MQRSISTRIQLTEWQLGPPNAYIMRAEDRPFLIEWAVLKGWPLDTVNDMTNVALANLYCDHSEPENDIQSIVATAIERTIHAMRNETIDQELIRSIAHNTAIEAVNALAPRKVEVITPRGSVILPGTVHYKTETIIRVVGLGHAVMMVGPAGCGKTRMGEDTARALQLSFGITSTINETHELLGFVNGYGNYQSTPFRHAFENGGVWIADEIDAWDAAALLAANSALANGYCTFPDRAEPVMRHPDFRMIATANTFGTGADRVYVGRNELDAASLDRFAVIAVDYDLTLERMFAGSNDRWLERIWSVRKAVNEKNIRHVVSSRAIAMGSAALAIGLDWDEVEEMYLWKGLRQSDRDKIG